MKQQLEAYSIDNVSIAAPCKVDWESMSGDEKQRLCQQCSLHVYDLSAMTKEEATELINTKREHLCLRIFRRTDGTIIFENCPVGLRRIRDGIKWTMRIAASFVAAVFSACAAMADGEQKSEKLDAAPNNINMTWTLVENGPTERQVPVFNTNWNRLKYPPEGGQLAQLGSIDRYAFMYTPVNSAVTKIIAKDWSTSDYFQAAMKSTEAGKTEEANELFKKASEMASALGEDPLLREFIGEEYAKSLKKSGDVSKAVVVENDTKQIKLNMREQIERHQKRPTSTETRLPGSRLINARIGEQGAGSGTGSSTGSSSRF